MFPDPFLPRVAVRVGKGSGYARLPSPLLSFSPGTGNPSPHRLSGTPSPHRLSGTPQTEYKIKAEDIVLSVKGEGGGEGGKGYLVLVYFE